MDENDICYECTAYGDDYYVNENGELVCACDKCSVNPRRVREGEKEGEEDEHN